MRIAVIGAGAMGSIYGGHLSLHNEVYLVDTNPNVVAAVNENGLKLQEYGTDNLYHPKAVTSTEGIEPVDLIILFVKALFSKAALAGNKALIGPNTYVLTLQNGSGHEDILGEFVDLDHIIIGTTEDNGAVLGMGYIRHGGEGNTNVGMLVEDKEGLAQWFNTDARFKEVRNDMRRAERAGKKPFFGRIDIEDPDNEKRESFYIGKTVIAMDPRLQILLKTDAESPSAAPRQ